jgi:hypothetical protein
MGLSEAVEFLRAATDAELQARRAKRLEPDEKKFMKLVARFDAMRASGMASGISRPEKPRAYYTAPEQKKAAAKLQARTLFAAARYQQGKNDLYRAWLGPTEVGPRGDGLYQNLFVAVEAGALKIVAEYTVCFACFGALKLKDGADCSDCSGGWRFDAGKKISKLGAVREVRRLIAPTDPLTKPAYALITDPE